MPEPPWIWFRGKVRPRDEAVLRVDDSAYADGRGCYTSARVEAGRVRFEARHVERLTRSAGALGLGEVAPDTLVQAFRELATAAFPDGSGVIRLQISRGAGGAAEIAGVPRPIGREAATWSAITAPQTHPGALVAGGHKLTNRLVQTLAGDAARSAGVDEALLFDAEGRLVEGSRSNVVVVDREGHLQTPPESRGAVSGLALGLLLERVPGIERRDLRGEDLARAAAIVCTNAVRGVRPLVCLDGQDVGASTHPALAPLLEAFAHD